MAELRQQTTKGDAYSVLYDTLNNASSERDQRWDFVRTTFGLEPEWSVYERQSMLDAVNQLRAGNGLPPVDMAWIELADYNSYGKGWLSRLAEKCAAMAVGEDWRG